MKSYHSNTICKQANALLPADFQIQENNLPVEKTWQWKDNNINTETK